MSNRNLDWKVSDDFLVVNGNGEVVADPHPDDRYSRVAPYEYLHANAHLIAAAPEMLDNLKHVSHMLTSILIGEEVDIDWAEKLQNEIHDTIAKAKGVK